MTPKPEAKPAPKLPEIMGICAHGIDVNESCGKCAPTRPRKRIAYRRTTLGHMAQALDSTADVHGRDTRAHTLFIFGLMIAW